MTTEAPFTRSGVALGMGFDMNGDNKCHPLCYPDSFAGEAGTVAHCTMPQVCTDIWGIFSSANPVGLCI